MLNTYTYKFLAIYRSIKLGICLSIFLSIYLYIYLSIYISIYLSIFPSNHLSIYIYVYINIYTSLYLYQYTNLSIYISFYLFVCPYIDQSYIYLFNFYTNWNINLIIPTCWQCKYVCPKNLASFNYLSGSPSFYLWKDNFCPSIYLFINLALRD